MEKGLQVRLMEKRPDGTLRNLDVRFWTKEMIDALQAVNFLTVGGHEYETVEGRLNVDQQVLELLVLPVKE
ncbi:hypothetical protein FHS18_002774 [Paenibacillus phyllosphaerae]|uniref:Uncharacterized protein n=1 Tax=Paenibacillus phyllosphaerae TaxID=274593 RepID=A0A7W5AXU1_9BACL|nr:hypothetical protein [Paenibacillus phyllosphaerae]MBB3110707.1 hypothetical protein [Paenibacillus phyllosphaerae]